MEGESRHRRWAWEAVACGPRAAELEALRLTGEVARLAGASAARVGNSLVRPDNPPRTSAMALSVFEDKTHAPSAAELTRALGGSARLWFRLVAEVAREHGPIVEQWNHAGARFGWSLRLRRRDRVVLYLTPQSKGFMAGVLVGEKAAKAARERGLPAAALRLLEAAPRYAEGRGVRVSVRTLKEVEIVLHLVALKLVS